MNTNWQKMLSHRILPAVTFESEKDVLPVAEVFLEAGLHCMEIPFRTPVAEKCVRLLRTEFPDMQIGAGTLLTVRQVETAVKAGAQFGLGPGFNPAVCNAATRHSLPFIPGVMTPSEIEQAYESGFSLLKLFPVAFLGGPAFLKAVNEPYRHLNLSFLPMGGINGSTLQSYLEIPQVMAVGGSWMAAKHLIAVKDYSQIRENISSALNQVSSV